MKYPILVVAAGLLSAACHKLVVCEDEKLRLPKTDYAGAALKLNGFYYGEPTTDFRGVTSYNVMVLSRNGVVCRPGGAEQHQLADYLRRLTPAPDLLKRTKYAWGRFVIDGNHLRLEHWNPASCGHGISVLDATILNDTTFVLNTLQVRKDGRAQAAGAVNAVYRFQAFSPKPDSVVSFVE
jgi:hypothetical protein